MMKTSDDSSAPPSKAYQSTETNLWDQNIVNGEYIIAYELDYSLHQDLQNMLPKVYFILRTQKDRWDATMFVSINQLCIT